MREFLEEHFTDGLDQAGTIHLAIKTLLEVCESEKNIELQLIQGGNVCSTVEEADVATVVKQIQKEKEEAEAAKKKP